MTDATTPEQPRTAAHEHHWVEVLDAGSQVWFYCTGCQEKRIVAGDVGPTADPDRVSLVREEANCPECGHLARIIHRNSGAIYYVPIEAEAEAQARPAVASEGWECGVSNSPLGVCSRPAGHKGMHRRRPTARPAVASEGLRAALERLVQTVQRDAGTFPWNPDIEDALQQARAALASDAGSVGALPLASAEVNGLDVERLARALRAELAHPVGDLEVKAVAAAYDAAGEGGAGFYDDPNAPGNER